MSRPRTILQTGEIIYISDGYYSDYGVSGVFVVAQSFNWQTAQKDFLKRDPGKNRWEDYSGLPAWLVAQGYIVELDATEWHTEEGIN